MSLGTSKVLDAYSKTGINLVLISFIIFKLLNFGSIWLKGLDNTYMVLHIMERWD